MNPNHWPVQDWVSMGYFHERLMVTDGSYNPTVPWLAKSLSYETPHRRPHAVARGRDFP